MQPLLSPAGLRHSPKRGLIHIAGFVRLGVVIDTVAASHWLALLVLALWPTWWWMGQRLVDGSDDPLGVLALGALAALWFGHRKRLCAAPHLGLLTTAWVGVVVSTAMHHQWPYLVVSLTGLLSLAAGLLAFLPAQVARAPVWGLSVLSLPLLASLQFYAGFPLRVLTAEVSRWVLALAFTVERSGSSLVVNGQLVIVDAPCSGVQMAWLGYFTACAVALFTQRTTRSFLLRLPVVSALVLLGNVLRNTLLVSAQAAGTPLPTWLHEALGLLVLGLVCGGIAWAMGTKGVPA